jgi:hypothetical protein
MKTSDQPTTHLLIKAGTNSEWDTCEFAIIYLSQQWKHEQEKRLENILPFQSDSNLMEIYYYDTDVDFYRTDQEELPDIEQLLGGADMVFVEPDDNDTFAFPENSLDCYRIFIDTYGTARYMGYGIHTNEEFSTKNFSLPQLIERL